MDVKLCRKAGDIIGCQFIGCHQFLTDAIIWAGNNIAEFQLGYDDFRHHWYGSGAYQIDANWKYPDPTAGNAHDAMALLVIDYDAWRANRTCVTPPAP